MKIPYNHHVSAIKQNNTKKATTFIGVSCNPKYLT